MAGGPAVPPHVSPTGGLGVSLLIRMRAETLSDPSTGWLGEERTVPEDPGVTTGHKRSLQESDGTPPP